MRTTLSLDDDVAAQIERRRGSSGQTLKEIVNSALRLGLLRMSEPPKKRQRFQTKAVSLGRCYLPSLDDVSEVLAAGEGERFR